jgi:hypothetical protein
MIVCAIAAAGAATRVAGRMTRALRQQQDGKLWRKLACGAASRSVDGGACTAVDRGPAHGSAHQAAVSAPPVLGQHAAAGTRLGRLQLSGQQQAADYLNPLMIASHSRGMHMMRSAPA